MGNFCAITMWLSSDCLWSTCICVNTRRVIHKLFQCQDLCQNKISFKLTCLRRHASRTQPHLPWWCGSCRLGRDHWGRWPSVQPACGWRSVTVWWGCACRNKKIRRQKELEFTPALSTVKIRVHRGHASVTLDKNTPVPPRKCSPKV